MAMRDNGPLPGFHGLGGLAGQEGEPGNAQSRYATRIGDADRDAAAAELGEHYAAGRLTLDELHDRLGHVLAARTRGQLLHVMADLPASRWPTPGTTARAATPSQASRSRQDQEQGSSDNVSRFAAVALLLVAMLIWLFTALMFASHGYYHGYYVHHQYWQNSWQQQP
jgi:hypothetical protein